VKLRRTGRHTRPSQAGPMMEAAIGKATPSMVAVASLLTVIPHQPPARPAPAADHVRLADHVHLVSRIQPASRTYTVRPGDTLFYISQHLYGTPGHWREIWQANTDKITDPNLIDVGEVLTIPAQTASAQTIPAQTASAQTIPAQTASYSAQAISAEPEDSPQTDSPQTGTSQPPQTDSGPSRTGSSQPPQTGSSGGSNQAVLQAVAAQFGWTGGEWAALQQLESMEDATYSTTIANPSSGALGMGQALGHGTAGSAGSLGNEYGANYGLTTAQAQQANSGSAQYQALWMCTYIRDTYGMPSAAVQFHLANNYY
jgi:LysM repeat protein